MGELQKILDSGEYFPLRSVPVFESSFIQVNRRGESVYFHNRPNYVTMGVCASSTSLSLPNLMLLARLIPASSQEGTSMCSSCSSCSGSSYSEDTLALTRFLPLKFVTVSIHSVKKKRIKLKLVSGRAYYLELSAPPKKQAFLFSQWMQLIRLLKTESTILFQHFGMQEEQEAASDTTWKRNNQEQPAWDQGDRRDPEKVHILKQVSSKRVTMSEAVGPIEQVGKSKGQEAGSSYNLIQVSSGNSEKQNKQQKELRKKSVTQKKSRERGPFSHSEKRLQTSGILKNVSKPELISV